MRVDPRARWVTHALDNNYADVPDITDHLMTRCRKANTLTDVMPGHMVHETRFGIGGEVRAD